MLEKIIDKLEISLKELAANETQSRLEVEKISLVVKKTHAERYSTELKLRQLQLDICFQGLRALKEENADTLPSLGKGKKMQIPCLLWKRKDEK